MHNVMHCYASVNKYALLFILLHKIKKIVDIYTKKWYNVRKGQSQMYKHTYAELARADVCLYI